MNVTTKESALKLQQPVETLIMIPRTHKLSVLARKMYTVMLYLSQSSLRKMGAVPAATHLFDAPLPEILKICGADGQRTSAKQYLAEMRKAEVEWRSPDEKSELQAIAFSLLAETRISHKEGMVWIHWGLAPSLYEALLDPERWATIDLLVLSRLHSYTAIALYAICTKYRDNPSHLTCRNDPSWWVDALSASPASIDPATGLRKRREWRKYKDEKVLDAIIEINRETDLLVELIEDKQFGKAIQTVQFKVNIKRAKTEAAAVSGDKPVGTEGGEIVDFANRLGVKDAYEVNTMTRKHGEDVIRSSLFKLEERLKQQNLPLVRSPSGYLRSLLTDPPIVASELMEGKAPPPAPVRTLARAAFTPVKSWVDVRREQIFQEILTLTLEEQAEWVAATLEHLKSCGRVSPSIERRFGIGDWTTGVVKVHVTDFYAVSRHGQDWAVEPNSGEGQDSQNILSVPA